MSLIYKDIDYTACRRGFEEFELDSGETLLWPRCEISGCPMNVCIGMSKSLCYPHGIEFGAFTKEQFEADRLQRHRA
jgi:hypothetical protein